MTNWSDAFQRFLDARLGSAPERNQVTARFQWVEDLHRESRDILSLEALRQMPPPEVYARLKALSVPRCPIRLTNLGRVNDAERVKESLIRLLETPGNFAEKYKAAKFPQAGVVTLTEILCVVKPMRFILRNAMFTKELAKVVPLYTRRGLQELPYEEFLDICRELARITQQHLIPAGLADWAKTHRFLLLFAVLTE